MNSPAPAAVVALCQKVSAAQGVELYHVEFSGRVLRVTIDAPGGTSMAACARFSRDLSSELDGSGALSGRYFLEVSSPGVERRLYRPPDFARGLGQGIRVKTREGTREGTLVAADDTAITLEWIEQGQPRTALISYCDVIDARLVVPDRDLFAPRTLPRDQHPAAERPAQRPAAAHEYAAGKKGTDE